ncbi:hypothetical protein DBR06_SOUSAS19910025 [Sousa chinensis]|uniref:Uncharacterized protein n=1 Tax=Sousa chinensis TaxID=103600 RepID=A0A484H3B6_SOUCH|nr:hypothetical protein DBR06_SOUSAS19910025 [Sousa chinensis]
MSLWILPSSVATRLKVVLAAFRTETNHSFCGPNHKEEKGRHEKGIVVLNRREMIVPRKDTFAIFVFNLNNWYHETCCSIPLFKCSSLPSIPGPRRTPWR